LPLAHFHTTKLIFGLLAQASRIPGLDVAELDKLFPSLAPLGPWLRRSPDLDEFAYEQIFRDVYLERGVLSGADLRVKKRVKKRVCTLKAVPKRLYWSAALHAELPGKELRRPELWKLQRRGFILDNELEEKKSEDRDAKAELATESETSSQIDARLREKYALIRSLSRSKFTLENVGDVATILNRYFNETRMAEMIV
jgi:hypothetical protein